MSVLSLLNGKPDRALGIAGFSVCWSPSITVEVRERKRFGAPWFSIVFPWCFCLVRPNADLSLLNTSACLVWRVTGWIHILSSSTHIKNLPARWLRKALLDLAQKKINTQDSIYLSLHFYNIITIIFHRTAHPLQEEWKMRHWAFIQTTGFVSFRSSVLDAIAVFK